MSLDKSLKKVRIIGAGQECVVAVQAERLALLQEDDGAGRRPRASITYPKPSFAASLLAKQGQVAPSRRPEVAAFTPRGLRRSVAALFGRQNAFKHDNSSGSTMSLTLGTLCLGIVLASVRGGGLPLATVLNHTRLQSIRAFPRARCSAQSFFHMLPEAVRGLDGDDSLGGGRL